MDRQLLAEAEAIFHAAAHLPPERRERILSEQCGEDAELRAFVDRLLASHDSGMGSFLESHTDETATRTAPKEPPHEACSIGPYRILETIGEGGMGTVYAAEQTQPLRRKVALKVIKPGMDSKQVIARFEAERQALALMDHPNIAKVLDAGETELGRPYFVMDLVKGERITDYCDRHTLSTKERLELFVAVCHAVQHAHQKGIIHRDLKPSNILVMLSDGRPSPKVIDFGIAKATTTSLTEMTLHTQQGQLIGTPAYMSPEQAEMGPLDVDTRSDVYSLGVILYELLAGTPPFDPQTLRNAGLAEIQQIIREEEPPKPSTKVSTAGADSQDTAKRRGTDPRALVRELKGELDWIVFKAIQKDRTRRYETASSLAADIGRYLRDEPVQASPPSAAYRFRKFAKRHKVALGFAATVFFGITLALFESNRQRAKTEIALSLAQDARDESQQAQNESEAVTEFLSEMLASADPAERGREVTVKAVLDEASKTIAGKFEGQPLTEARLRQTIGHVYGALGEFDTAESNQRRAMEMRTEVLGSDDPATLRSRFDLATTLTWRGRLDEAESLLHETLGAQRRVLGENHPETLDSWEELARVQYARGRYDEAEAIYVKTLDIRRSAEGEKHPGTLRTAEALALVYWKQRRFDEAESLATLALETARRTLGEKHPQTLDHAHTLAAAYYDQGRLDEAEALYREILEAQRHVLGDDHVKLLQVKHNLALVYVDQGRYEEGKALLRESLQTVRRVMGENHDGVWRILRSLGWASREQGHYAEAESLFQQVLESARSEYGEEHPRTADALFDLACLSALQGHRDKALALLRQAVEAGFSAANRMASHSNLESLRGDPEFQALVAEVRRRSQTESSPTAFPAQGPG